MHAHGENITVKVTVEFCNRKINRHSAIIQYPFISQINISKTEMLKFVILLKKKIEKKIFY